MNFAPFTGHIPTAAAIPSIHQFAAKFGYEGTGNTGVVQETRYQNTGGGGGVQFAVAPTSSGVSVDGVKFRQAESVVVVSSAQPGAVTLAGIAPLHSVNTGVKYQTISTSSVNLGNIAYGGQASYVQAETVHQQLKAEQRTDKREYRDELHHDLMATMMQQHQVTQATPLQQGTQQLLVVLHEPKEAAALARAIKQETRPERAAATAPAEFIISCTPGIGDVTDSSTWQTLGGGVADYLSALPLPLHHLLKYSTPANSMTDGKRDDQPTIVTAVAANALPSMSSLASMPTNAVNSVVVQTATIVNQTVNANTMNTVTAPKRKKKKKTTKEKKPRPKPGEIRLSTALDGSTLYCCPECHMAYPERGLLEQHLVGHTMERRFVCDICHAALKRKDHLTRHKQSHNPERPHVCSVCLKAFKRKEQLTLHYVIHSGEKRHICNECGKGFYRKDHLRKHTRSHIARRVKAELSQQSASGSPPLPQAVPAPTPEPS
ncbi:zinc finger and BTB domain-containing protein 14-like isoform X1 [Achroia grisella]|uniref:zinc finger and BTB domain-containing protein 14-like isoform X1 n=1 Tax=Achroia grisella TaxID=688607 RepID=UPI0027D31042|nr:zinc finger and BTB domain-containing protein 14-like isoform X1 [Achroia grisella]